MIFALHNFLLFADFSKIVEKTPSIKILYLDQNKLSHTRELDNISKLSLVELKLEGNPFTQNFKDPSHYSRYVGYMSFSRG